VAASNLKLFDENKANMLSDEEYNTNTQRLNGVQTGVASSSLQNKTLYQTSLVAYAIGQLMIANGKDATDSVTVSTFVANMDATMLQKVKDIATTEEAKQGLLNTKYMTPALTKVAIEYMLAHDITLGGSLTLHSDPTTGLQAATKNYVDTTIASKEFYKLEYEQKIEYNFTGSRLYYDINFTPKILPCLAIVNINASLYKDIKISLHDVDILILDYDNKSNINHTLFLPISNIRYNSFYIEQQSYIIYNYDVLQNSATSNIKITSKGMSRSIGTISLKFYSINYL
jgi:hypothetical protein